jgi:hypothetical protein
MKRIRDKFYVFFKMFRRRTKRIMRDKFYVAYGDDGNDG